MHQSVMIEEAISSLNLKHGSIVVDGTVGGGGHSLQILKMITPAGRMIGIDADASVLKIAQERLKDFSGSFTLVNDNFRNIDRILSKENAKDLDAILLDIGISSYQIEDTSRGFSIKNNSRLDMRMDPRSGITAYDIVNRYSEKDLSDIIEEYGEERFHNKVARYIVYARQKKPIETTQELALIVRRAVGYRYRNSRIDPATRTFQAIRIEVNDELRSLEEGLKSAIFWLKTGGRIVVISFHSLEDRIVKNLFKGYAELGILKIITKKPLTPSQDEVFNNPRARSAKMRVAERIK
ncbi:MAG: 16S rRNA (cytosine(1402)-N(4))-methyltransferase RsmH [Candidatus Omnitrophota bacterium]|nr:16S rRNA (cytosine(1402)-N(4))-methyltransferase RsmH [Candidatus Omnitrophota bacterium]